MFVGTSRQFVWQIRQIPPVGQDRRAHASTAWLRACRTAAVCLVLIALSGCGAHPDELIVGRWQELDWHYEKFDGYEPEQRRWMDGVRFPSYDRHVVRHEAEYWEFRPDHVLVISKRNGTKVHARWHLKGRGHVLTLRSLEGEQLEVYDVKELTRDQLVLNFDIGMEVRGIAQLTFGRIPLHSSALEDDRVARKR